MERTNGVLSVVGGRVGASSCSSNAPFHINGQQLMMQLDSLTSAMTDMVVSNEEEMEVKTFNLLRIVACPLFRL